MQITRPSNIFTSNVQIPYLSIVGVLGIIALVSFLWRPLNLHRTTYIPLTSQAETTVPTPKGLQAEFGNTRIEIVRDKARMPITLESSDIPEDDIITPDIADEDGLLEKTNDFQYIFARGDNVRDVLQGYDVNSRDIYLLTSKFKQIANVRVGQQISWTMDRHGNLLRFNWAFTNNAIRVYEKVDGKFVENIQMIETVAKKVVLQGTISSNFVTDARQSGLSSNEINTVLQTLQWRLDFRRLRENDKFIVLLSRNMNGEKIISSQVLGVRILANKQNYYAILADDGNFYDVDGSSLAQSFLRYPLAKRARISSNFNPRRLHPITGAVVPHNGVDFAVSRGTPVLAVGDGQVVVAKFSPYAGNYITLRHGRQYVTRYMHLDKLLVKPGQRVKRGDLIALSGNTGRSTGPHLHYEIRVNLRPVNPITAPLPEADGLTGKSKTVFLDKVKDITSQLLLLL